MFEYESNSEQIADKGAEGAIANDESVISWQSPDYKLKSKSVVWYLGMVLFISVVLLAIVFFQGFSILAVSEMVALIAIVVSITVATNRKPLEVKYSVNPYSLTANGKSYSLDNFRTFSVNKGNSGNEEIILIPNSDYSPPLSLRLDDVTKQQVFDIISESVPYKQIELGFIDKLARKIGI